MTMREERETPMTAPLQSPVLPLDVLVEHVAPFLQDRTTWNSFSLSAKNVHESLQRSVALPPWPSRLVSRDCMSRARVLAFSPDLSQLACGCTDGQVKLWQVRQGEQKPLDGHWPEETVVALTFSSDGFILASASTDHTIKLWSLAGKRTDPKITIHTGHVACLSFSHDDKLMVVGHHNAEVISIFNLESGGQKIHELRGGNGPVPFARLTNDGKHVIAKLNSKKLKIWNVESRECVRTWPRGHFSAILPKQVGDDLSIQVASVQDQDSFKVWTTSAFPRHQAETANTADRHTSSTISISNCCSYIIQFSADGRKVACVDDFRGLYVYDTRSGESIVSIQDTGLFPANSISFGGSTNIAVVSRQFNAIHIYRV